MRLYNKRVLRKKTDRRVAAKRETRDAIVWDVLSNSADRKCRVKIQGSNQLIVAHYPFNWGINPVFVKPGNAVKINHQGGARGKIEVVGHGQLVPTPVSGSGAPNLVVAPDGIITGLSIHEMPDPDSMKIWVKVGTFRIAGIVYTLPALTMEELTAAGFGDNLLLGVVGAVIDINDSPSVGFFRQDLITVGTDLIVDYVAGSIVSSNPAPASIPSNHIGLGTILIHGSMTIVTNKEIDAVWSVPFLAFVRASLDDDVLDWASETSSIITVSAVDQYDIPFSRSLVNGGILFSLEILTGNGTLQYAVTSTFSEISVSGSSVTFLYTRGNVGGDSSPTLQAAAEESFKLIALDSLYIALHDANGEIMF